MGTAVIPRGAILGILPLYHIMGLTTIYMFALYVSVSLVVILDIQSIVKKTKIYVRYNGLRCSFFKSPITPELYVKALRLVKPFLFSTVPWILEELAVACKLNRELLSDLQTVKYVSLRRLKICKNPELEKRFTFFEIFFGGAKLALTTSAYYHENNVHIISSYGQTELSKSKRTQTNE
jgi:long-subunit acyl-CoA synthetase (AMP-forming)